MTAYSNYGDIPKENDNEQIKKQRQKTVEKYIIDINNKLAELCEYLHLDIKEIKKINPNEYGSDKIWKETFGDKEKKVLISSIVAEEKAHDAIKDFLNLRKSTEESLDSEQSESAKRTASYFVENVYTGSTDMQGQHPPKTDWKRIDISKDEKEKIIESIKANPESKIFSKSFPWNINDFYQTFKFLEDSTKYTGPFIISIIKDSSDIEQFSNIEEISNNIPKIYAGKYLLLSVYDITASSKYGNEAKIIYIGLKYNGMEGVLEFDTLGSQKGIIKSSQKTLVMEFMDAMGIKYDIYHKDFSVK